MVWPDSKPIRWRVAAGLPTPRVSHADGRTELIDDITDATGPQPPIGAPPRYRYRAQLEVTQFADWAQVSALMAPLYDTSATLPRDSALAAEAAAIKAAAKTPAERASLALALVQRKVRYEFVGLDDGNYRPAAAAETWARRYGDCKGKTVLLLALLRELGVEAEPVLVSTGLGDGMEERLPQLAYFDHVLVRAKIGDAAYWLDGTKPADPRDLNLISPPPFKWGLPLRPAGATLIKIEPRAPQAPLSEETTWIDASAGLDAPAAERRLAVTHGDLAMSLGLSINQLPRDQAEKALRDAFRRRRLVLRTEDHRLDLRRRRRDLHLARGRRGPPGLALEPRHRRPGTPAQQRQRHRPGRPPQAPARAGTRTRPTPSSIRPGM